ncbi:LACTB protein [Balamuthia mandrillaris]
MRVTLTRVLRPSSPSPFKPHTHPLSFSSSSSSRLLLQHHQPQKRWRCSASPPTLATPRLAWLKYGLLTAVTAAIGSASYVVGFASGCSQTAASSLAVAEETRELREDIIERCQRLLLTAKEDQGFPGCTIAVMKEGELVWSHALGLADVENAVGMRPNHLMRVASISKSMTAAAVGLLWERGKLDLDAPVKRYVPTFQPLPPATPKNEGERAAEESRNGAENKTEGKQNENETEKAKDAEQNDGKKNDEQKNTSGKRDEEGEKKHEDKWSKDQVDEKIEKGITTRRVAGHIGGIRHYKDRAEFESAKHYENVSDALAIFQTDPLDCLPGQKYHYSTYGWNLISAVVEAASGEDFLTFMQKNVFDVLGMNHTQPEYHDPILPNRTRYYVRDNATGRLRNAPYVDNSNKWAGGGFIATAEDVAKFGNALLAGEILKFSTVSLLFKPQVAVPRSTKAKKFKKGPIRDMGYGIGFFSMDGKSVKGHKTNKQAEETFAAFVEAEANKKNIPGETYTRISQDHIIFHTGGAVGGSSVLTILPEEGVVVAIITNLENVNLTDLSIEIAECWQKEDRVNV